MTDPPALEAQAAIRNMAKEAGDAPDQDKELREELEAEEAEKQFKKNKAVKGRGKGKGKGRGKGRGGRGKKARPDEEMPATTHDAEEKCEVGLADQVTDSPPVMEMEPPNDSLTPESTGHKPIKRRRSKLRRLKALSPSSSAKKAAKCRTEPVAVPESQQDDQWGGTDGDFWDGDWHDSWEWPTQGSEKWETNHKGLKKRKTKKTKGNRKKASDAPPTGMSSNLNGRMEKAKAKAKVKSKDKGQGNEQEKPGAIDEGKELKKKQEADSKKDGHVTRWS